ncbi:YybH family protein [Rheinheimera sp. 4Y26]|uniref:YybH family protein n=1 Tax=Rheinheimera sp. 4Y26 TaxID=2977811 RepID=UPI0021B14EEA|nr:nuclear transport factor 2 family protein [Rheinheimera sp. 4Y26]MCT6701038.1 nuclear transport factor 2 family protein [Rheinheimera sp. 4Y26]
MQFYQKFSVALLLAAVSNPLWAHGKSSSNQAVDAAVYQSAAGQVVQQFHQALQQGKRDLVLAQLSPAVQIFEGGAVERSRDEYKAHHLDADIKYLSQVSSELLEQQIEIIGDVAYAVSRSSQKGEIKGKKIDRTGIESLVLRNIRGQWQIVLVHWS